MTSAANAATIQACLRDLADPAIAEHSARFFKTGKGEYGEGDRFLGIRVPTLRQQLRQFAATSLTETLRLLRSPYHEERLFALLLLVHQYAKASDEAVREKVYQSYLDNTLYINNWDLVDTSCHLIVGAHLLDKPRDVLFDLAVSESLWERRIAIISTLAFIRLADYVDTLAIAERLLADEEDLLHKAVGWMLREVGKRDPTAEERFLETHYHSMPRTMLRYAIERFPKERRAAYLAGKV